MRKLFIKFLTLLFVLGLSVNAAWADDGTIYYASLKAQTDPASTGSGKVKLTWLDITGKPMEVDLAKQLNWAANSDIDWTNPTEAMPGLIYMGSVTNWDEESGAQSSVGPATTAQVLGGTMIAIEGTEVAQEIGGSGSQIYMTSVVYFHAEVEPDNGSYLTDWIFTDPQITRMNSSMSPADPMGDGSEERPYRTPCFKVLPMAENSVLFPADNEDPTYATKMAGAMAVAQNTQKNSYNNLFALFSKYLLSNPEATNANMEAEENETANLSVTVEINGDAASLDAADFASFTFTNNENSEWAYDLAAALASKEVVSDQKTRITIPVTYTYKNTGFGLKNTTMTISMAGASPSVLNVNLSVNALDPDRAEAFLLEGKDDASPLSGTLADMLAKDISGYTDPIVKLNKPVEDALTFSGKDFTLDLNGNTTQALIVSGGNVTIAFSNYGGSVTSLTVNGGKAILNGGTFGSLTIGASGTVEQNGATITGAANNSGSLTTTEGTINGGLTSSKTLVVNGGTFNGATAVTVSGGTANINRGTLTGTTLGLLVSSGTANVKKLAVITSEDDESDEDVYSAQQTGSGTLNVESGKFGKPLNGTVNFTAGFFKTNSYGVSTEDKTEMNVSAGVEYNEGYRYFLGTPESALANGVGVCRIGTTSYARLEDAIAYANNNPSVQNIVIFMTNNYTLPAGYYTLPANATIVVPMSDSQEKEVNMTAPRVVFNDQRTATPYVDIQPTEFRRLTFASGVNMDVFGDIEVTCSQYASNEAYTAQPVGPYGRLVIEENSHITLQSGSEFRAWGFVTGKGEMDARRGATVREMFQLGDWKGAFTSVKIVGMVTPDQQLLYNIIGDESDKKIFPVTQYFIQNIESPVKYHPGAVLSTSATVSEGLMGMSISMGAPDIAIVGVSGQHQAIFLMDQMADADNTWVRKWYDAENDIQVYDINSAAHIGSMVLDMGDINLPGLGTVPIRLNSAKFDLPLTCNFKIHLLSGTMDFQQNTSLLPGAEVEVDKGATVTVAMTTDEKNAYDAWVDGGKSGNAPVSYTGALYVYDAEEWDQYAYCNEYDGSGMQTGKAYTKTVRYAPSWEGRGTTPGKPDVRKEQVKPADAAINVHGTFSTSTGFVYCSESGANIFSNNEDAGTFIFNESAEDAGTRTVYNVKGSGDFESLTFYPAQLKNGNGGYADTQAAEEGDAYCYQNDEWSTMTVDGCFVVKHNEETDIYYAKPQEYVALANGMTENEDHTYSDAAGAGRLFILMDNCQWWEVEKKDNLYHCIHPDNDTYYYWDGEWVEKKFTITWKNWNGDIIHTADADGNPHDSYEVTYGTMAEFLGTNPTREKNLDYTYDFTGWTPALGKVTSDVTYTATFAEKPRKYTIIFQQDGGLEIERQFLLHNDVPVCENTPTKIGHTLVWSPAIAAVTGDATYTATWKENPPTEYQVTFYDYNGTTVLQQGNVAVGSVPTPPANPTGKPGTDEYTYVFDHWSPALEAVSVEGPKSYTAVYREVAKTYTVRFYQENGTTQIGEAQSLAYGEMPVAPNYTKEETGYTITVLWKNKADASKTIETVKEDADYIADVTTLRVPNKYTVTLRSNPSEACTFAGAGMYDYGSSITISQTPKTNYTFTKWTDEDGNEVNTLPTTVNGDITLIANFTFEGQGYTITWKNWDGTLLASGSQKENTATTYVGATPTREPTEAVTYAFYGWSEVVNPDPSGEPADVIYKNGLTPKATGDATYYAYFNESARTYDIAWKNEAGTVDIELDYNQPYGAAIAFNSATPTKTATAEYTYTFDGWSTTVGGDVEALSATVSGNAIFYAHFVGTPVVSGYNLEIGVNDKETLAAATTKDNLIITSNGVSSGQLINADNLKLNGEAIFRMEKAFNAEAWYAVAVPWTVNPSTGIYAGSSPLSLGGQIYVIEFDANAYAGGSTNTFDYWTFLHETGADMIPGKLYMIYLASGQSQLDFHKKAGADILTTETSVAITGGDDSRANWNAIANPALYHANLSTGATLVQKYNGNDSYIVGSTSGMIVGEPMFVQVTSASTVDATPVGGASPAPYRRAPKTEDDTKFVVELTQNGQLADRMIVQTAEEKENCYVIGQDLAKFGVSSKVAQMWVNRYDAKLCVNTVAPLNGVAEYPLSIFAPAAGEYEINCQLSVFSDQIALYLTYNGEAIWNLSDAAYTLTLEKGTSTQYGLRISVRKAPEIVTDIDEAVVEAQGNIRKVLINDKVFIIRGEKVYSIDGQIVK